MEKKEPVFYQDVEKCVDALIGQVGKKITMAIPLAMGKPNHLVNALYRRTKVDPQLHFTLITAVTLEKPTWSSDLERRFLEPLVERVWGDFPDFDYILDLRKNQIPPNFELVEFYNKTAGFVNCPHAQQNYLGSNYTHAIRDGIIQGANVISQLIAKEENDGKLVFSMGSNPDTNLDALPVLKKMRAEGRGVAVVGQVNSNMPFMRGKAIVDPGEFDFVIDNPDYDFTLFGAPKEAVSTTDWMIGLHASTLVKDDGTLQVGIGSLGDAIVSGLEMRHKENDAYKQVLNEAGIVERYKGLIDEFGGTDVFDKGLLASTEMFVDSLIELFKAGILKRRVYENYDLQTLLNEGAIEEKVTPEMLKLLLEREVIASKLRKRDFEFLTHFGIFKDGLVLEDGMLVNGDQSYSSDLSDEANLAAVLDNCLGDQLKQAVVIYASFFIGPQKFYDSLRNLSDEDLSLIDMRSVDYVNHLYGDDMPTRMAQRKNGRFINAALMVMMNGATVADGLEDHKIISGPGGQYNFISMAHALPDGRAVTMVRSTRGTGEKAVSNIVWQYGHTTIPRHLRDIVVTEYGIADMRGQRDKEVMKRLINIADSRFQDELLAKAKKAKKIPEDYEIPAEYRNNTPERLEKLLAPYREKGLFPMFPFGTDFTDEEVVIGKALKGFKEKASKGKMAVMAPVLRKMFKPVPETAVPYLSRLQLENPGDFKEKMLQKVVLVALEDSGAI